MASLVRHLLIFVVATAWTFVSATDVLGGGGPENLVLVVNAGSPASLSVANEYIALRKIPSQNVIYLTGITTAESWDLKSFKARILGPIFETMKERKLVHIDYIVYSADFPTAISIGAHSVNFIEKAKVPKPNRKIFKPTASINALTYFARQVLVDDSSYLALTSNLYMRDRAAKLLIVPFVGKTQEVFRDACQKYKAGHFADAEKDFAVLAKAHPRQIAVQYWLARSISKQGDVNKTTNQILKCIQVGWPYREYTKSDEAFSEWQDSKIFQSAVDRIPDNDFYYLPTTHFRANQFWSPNGMRNGDRTQGQRYYLSTVLAVTRNRGTTEAEAIQNLRTSASADHTHPQGKFYFTTTKDVRTKTRVMHFERVIEKLAELGYEGEIVSAVLPKNKKDVLGLTIGSAGYNLVKTRLTIVPGAIVDNLTSFGGVMNPKSSQTPLSVALKSGAAGASGTVTEPFALIDKFPHPNIHLHYVRGSSLAEAFYQSVHGPYMLLIVGDALCQPWAQKTDFEIKGISEDGLYSGDVSLTATQTTTTQQPNGSGVPLKIAGYEIFIDGILRGQIGDGKSVNLQTSTMNDGFHELRLVAIANNQLRWQTSQIVPMLVNNHGNSVNLEIVGEPMAKFDKQFELRFESEIATPDTNTDVNETNGGGSNEAGTKAEKSAKVELAIFHNQRILATMGKAAGTVKIDAKKLGRGKNQLRAARKVGSKWIFSKPVHIEIAY